MHQIKLGNDKQKQQVREKYTQYDSIHIQIFLKGTFSNIYMGVSLEMKARDD